MRLLLRLRLLLLVETLLLRPRLLLLLERVLRRRAAGGWRLAATHAHARLALSTLAKLGSS